MAQPALLQSVFSLKQPGQNEQNNGEKLSMLAGIADELLNVSIAGDKLPLIDAVSFAM